MKNSLNGLHFVAYLASSFSVGKHVTVVYIPLVQAIERGLRYWRVIGIVLSSSAGHRSGAVIWGGVLISINTCFECWTGLKQDHLLGVSRSGFIRFGSYRLVRFFRDWFNWFIIFVGRGNVRFLFFLLILVVSVGWTWLLVRRIVKIYIEINWFEIWFVIGIEGREFVVISRFVIVLISWFVNIVICQFIIVIIWRFVIVLVERFVVVRRFGIALIKWFIFIRWFEIILVKRFVVVRWFEIGLVRRFVFIWWFVIILEERFVAIERFVVILVIRLVSIIWFLILLIRWRFLFYFVIRFVIIFIGRFIVLWLCRFVLVWLIIDILVGRLVIVLISLAFSLESFRSNVMQQLEK